MATFKDLGMQSEKMRIRAGLRGKQYDAHVSIPSSEYGQSWSHDFFFFFFVVTFSTLGTVVWYLHECTKLVLHVL